MANPNSKTNLAPIKEVEEDSDFEVPAPRAVPEPQLARAHARPNLVMVNTEAGRKPKALPADIEDEGLRAKSERKRVRSETHLGPKLTGALQGDEKFEEDAVQAAENHSIKRKKKYKYTEDGIPIEPFSIREEQESHIFDSTIVKDTKKDGSWDPWLLSVEEDMKNMEREDAQKEEDSDVESEEDDKGEDVDVEPLLGGEEEDKETSTEEEKLRLLEETCKLLLPKETVNKALVRLKGKPETKHANFKKNVRKKTTGNATEEKEQKTQAQAGNAEVFEKLMGLAGKLFDIGFISNTHNSNTQIAVYTDPKEDLEFEAKQLKALVERKKNRNKPQEEKKEEKP